MSHNLMLVDRYGEKSLAELYQTKTWQTQAVLGQSTLDEQIELYLRFVLNARKPNDGDFQNIQWLIDHIFEIKMAIKNWPGAKFISN